MTFTVILKILPYLLCAGVPSFFFIRNNIRKNKEHREDLAERNAKIVSLREQITSLVELNGDIEDVNEKKTEIHKVISDNPDIDDAYSKQLPNMPRKNRK